MKVACLDTYNGDAKELTPKYAWSLWQKGMAYKDRIKLFDTVKSNENFFIGKQWEGVEANGLPTPVYNVLKRVCLFIVASITTDNLSVMVTPLAATPGTQKLIPPAKVLNEELEALIERNRIAKMVGEFARDAAVRGDGCIYTYWDAKAETGQNAKGAIRSEVIENTRVVFGNPNDRRVQEQPYILIGKRAIRGEVLRRARKNGFDGSIESSFDTSMDDVKRQDDKVDDVSLFWKDDDGEVWMYEFTSGCEIQKPKKLGIRLYPITWLNWDYVQNSYHGQAMITGLIPNQIFINKAWAASMLSLLMMAFPKTIYDKNRIKKWDNRIGAAIGTVGDVTNVARYMEGANFSPQIGQFLQLAKSETESSLGATSVALGDTQLDNTSAIIAIQKAAATPSERTKQSLYESVEDLFRIYAEFMAEYYGKRYVDVSTPPELAEVYAFTGEQMPAEIPTEFDFRELKTTPMTMRLDVGASSYYSELSVVQTLNNLVINKIITPKQFFQCIPDTYLPMRRQILEELQASEQAQQAQSPAPEEETIIPQEQEIEGGGGYRNLQRGINQGVA